MSAFDTEEELREEIERLHERLRQVTRDHIAFANGLQAACDSLRKENGELKDALKSLQTAAKTVIAQHNILLKTRGGSLEEASALVQIGYNISDMYCVLEGQTNEFKSSLDTRTNREA